MSDKCETCFSCGILHPKVEAQGIWHCPNALCCGCGGAWFRYKLISYKENFDRTHCVDEDEWLLKGKEYNKKNKIPIQTFIRKNDYRKKMSGEYDKCGEHTLECLCPLPVPRRWVDKEEAKEMFPLDVLGIDEDKDSTTYFMTRMTQEEFEERTKGREKVDYSFNKIERVREE